MAPEPEYRSATTGRSTVPAASIAAPAVISVSGRGTNTPGPTATSTYRNAARPVRWCSCSRAARRATSASYAARSSGSWRTRSPRPTPRRWAASASASWRGDATPAAARISVAAATASPTREDPLLTGPGRPVPMSASDGGQALGRVGVDQRLDHGIQVSVEHGVEVVRLVADAVVGDAVLGEVVRSHAL